MNWHEVGSHVVNATNHPRTIPEGELLYASVDLLDMIGFLWMNPTTMNLLLLS